jgi:hypothetical protein
MAKELKIKVDENGCINPNELKGWFFPNWFEKEHFEEFLGRDIMSSDEFELWKTFLEEETDIYDKISNVVSEYLNDFKDNFKEWKKEQ